jgi:hypothetical protein
VQLALKVGSVTIYFGSSFASTVFESRNLFTINKFSGIEVLQQLKYTLSINRKKMPQSSVLNWKLKSKYFSYDNFGYFSSLVRQSAVRNLLERKNRQKQNLLRNVWSNGNTMCFFHDVAHDGIAMSQCNSEWGDQLWKLLSIGENDYAQLQNKLSKKCLAVRNNIYGTAGKFYMTSCSSFRHTTFSIETVSLFMFVKFGKESCMAGNENGLYMEPCNIVNAKQKWGVIETINSNNIYSFGNVNYENELICYGKDCNRLKSLLNLKYTKSFDQNDIFILVHLPSNILRKLHFFKAQEEPNGNVAIKVYLRETLKLVLQKQRSIAVISFFNTDIFVCNENLKKHLVYHLFLINLPITHVQFISPGLQNLKMEN